MRQQSVACRISGFLSAALVVIVTGQPLSSHASATSHQCTNAPVVINAEKSLDHQDICNTAAAALAFFGRLNFRLAHPLIIKIVKNLPNRVSENAIAFYKEKEQKIVLLSYTEFKKKSAWFGVPINRSMYRSLVTHEVSHAVASCNYSISEPTIHSQEYVAYVAMFAMMNPVLRTRVLAANPGTGFDTESEINELTYAFDPMHFGVQAYRHYLKEEHGDAFLVKILSGDALINSILDLP